MPTLLPAPRDHRQGHNEHLCPGLFGDLCENFVEMCTEEQNCPVREEVGCRLDSPVPGCFAGCLPRSTPHLAPCENSRSPTSCPGLAACSCLPCANPKHTKGHLLIALIGISLISNESEHLCTLLFWISTFVNLFISHPLSLF